MTKRWSLLKTARSLVPLKMMNPHPSRGVQFDLLQRHPNSATSAAARAANWVIHLSSVPTKSLTRRFMPCWLSLVTPPSAVTLRVSLSSPRTTVVAPSLTRTSYYSTARAQSIYSPTPLTLTMFVQLLIPSKFTATRALCRPTTSLILVPTRYMSTRMELPTSSHSSCLARNTISRMIAMIAGGGVQSSHIRGPH